MFYRLPILNPIQMIVSFANWKLLLMKWIEINPVTRMNQSIWSQNVIDFSSIFFLLRTSKMLLRIKLNYVYKSIPNGVSILFAKCLNLFVQKMWLVTTVILFITKLSNIQKLRIFGWEKYSDWKYIYPDAQ